MENEIGKDIRSILNGEDVRHRDKRRAEEDGMRNVPEEEPSQSPPPVKKKRGNSTYVFISYAFILIFLLLIGYLIYFNVYLKDAILNSPYNKRQDSAAEYVVRGEIRTSDGKTLAKTDVADDGTETRVYPYANEYAHVVGYVTHGKAGLESKVNYQLLTAHNNIIDQIINGFQKQKNPGDTVVTTLLSGVQDAAYHALGSYRGAIVAIDPDTGEIKAMVSQPDFDPNTLSSEWDSIVSDSSNSQLLNRATQGLYAPGSTFKIVTSLAYYDKHGSFDTFYYNCTGALDVGETTIHCYGGTAHGEENFTQAFANSCNTAFSEIGLDVGNTALTDAAQRLLFGQDLPGDIADAASQWKLTASSSEEELVQTAFGQGKTLTNPYHMALILSAIAGEGVLYKPHLVEHVENDAGTKVSTTKIQAYKTLMTAEEADSLQNLLRAVVTDGTGKALNGKSYVAYGKTGSADYIKTDGSTGTHSWFAGYGVKDGKKLVVVALAEDGGAGSSTAVPMASQVLDSYFGG